MTIIASALKATYPTAEFTISDNDAKTLDWHSEDLPKPSAKEIEAAVANYDTLLATRNSEKEAARKAVLDKLGLTADEVAALLG
jgi:hypothetical protein